MKWGFRTPSIRKRIAARTSIRRIIRHSLGLKAPRGWGWLTNPRKAAYNRVYRRTTFGLGRGCLVMVLLVLVPVAAVYSGCKDEKPENVSRTPHASSAPASVPAIASSQTAVRRIHAFISGRVQGVGFRAFTDEQAQRLKVTGFVRNLGDGRVELVAEGPAGDIEKLIGQVKHGPPSARVDIVYCSDEAPTGEYSKFEVKY